MEKIKLQKTIYC